MSLSKGQKRKVDNENRWFREEWREAYGFILPEFANAKPLCLICNEVISVCTEYNIRQHHKTKHGSLSASFPLKSESRRLKKICALYGSYIQSSQIVVRGLTTQEKLSSASLKASWILARHAEIMRDVMVSVLQELSTDKACDALIASVKQMPLSTRTAVCRIEAMSSEIQGEIIQALLKVDHYSLAIDESTDTMNVAQMCVYVRYFDDKSVSFQEELLFLIPLKGQTTGDILFAKEQFKRHLLPLEKIYFIVTDGAPSMVGKRRGLVSRLKEVAPNIQALHCLIHQTVLCAKLSGELKTVRDKVMRIINYIRGTSSNPL